MFPVFTFGSENWSWTQQTMAKIKGWETKTLISFLRVKRQKDETWVGYHKRTCNMARKTWVQMGLPFLCEIKLRKVCGVPWDGSTKSNALFDSLKKVYQWRSTRWWPSLHTRMMKEDP